MIIIKKIFIALMTLVLLITPAVYASENKAQQRELKTMDDVMRWSTFYYQEPTIDNVLPALKIAAKEKLVIDDLNNSLHIIHLFAAILQSNKAKIVQVKNLAEQNTGNAKKFLLMIIEEAENFQSPVIKDPNDMDCLWVEFFVTGSPEPIKKIMSVLLYTEKDMNMSSPAWKEFGHISKTQALDVLKQVAAWSLNSNAIQHKKVYDIISQELNSTTNKSFKEQLKIILENKVPSKT